MRAKNNATIDLSTYLWCLQALDGREYERLCNMPGISYSLWLPPCVISAPGQHTRDSTGSKAEPPTPVEDPVDKDPYVDDKFREFIALREANHEAMDDARDMDAGAPDAAVQDLVRQLADSRGASLLSITDGRVLDWESPLKNRIELAKAHIETPCKLTTVNQGCSVNTFNMAMSLLT